MANEAQPDKVEILVWALRMLGDDDYHFDPNGPDGGWELNIWEHPEEIGEEELHVSQQEYEAARQKLDLAFRTAFGSKKTSPTPTDVDDALIKMFLEPALRPILGKYLLRWRGQLGSSGRAKMEDMAIAAAQGDVHNAIVSQCLADMSARLPSRVKRIEELRVLTASVDVPKEVQCYVEEAYNCFISGHFLACLIVCRSAIEFAIRDFLTREGKQRELETLKTERGDTLYALIRVARDLRRNLRQSFDTADEVRRAASDAVHNRAPETEDCREAFIKTRGFLKELYA